MQKWNNRNNTLISQKCKKKNAFKIKKWPTIRNKNHIFELVDDQSTFWVSNAVSCQSQKKKTQNPMLSLS